MRGPGTGTAPYPFSALVGQPDLALALLLNAVSPAVGGVLVRGEKGTAKSTAVRGLARLLPEIEVVDGCPFNCDPAAPDPACPAGPHPADAPAKRRPVPLVELPVGASTDRVAGSLDLEQALGGGRRVFEPGLLAAAHRGILYVDEVNLLGDHLVDLLLDAAALGINYVEREGVSVRHAARFLLVGTMNPEEGELRPQLLDRFAITVEVRGNPSVAERVEVVRRRLAYEADPAAFAAAFAGADAALTGQIAAARDRLPAVHLPDELLARIAEVCAGFGVDGLRGDIVTAKTAMALAAWAGRDRVDVADVRSAALLALPHRRRRGPMDSPGLDERELDRLLGRDPDDDPDPAGPDRSSRSDGSDSSAGHGAGNGAGRRSPVGPHDSRHGNGAADPAALDPTSSPGTPGGSGAPGTPNTPPAEGGPPVSTLSETAGGAQGLSTASGAEKRAGQLQVAAPGNVFVPVWIALEGRGAGAWGRRSRAEASGGHPVADRQGQGHGHERSGLADLALAATLRAAALRLDRDRDQNDCDEATPGPAFRREDLRWWVRAGREGNLILFVLDSSGSMAARRRMTATKGAVLSLLLDAYQRRDRIGLVTFGGAGATVALPPTSGVELAAQRLAALPTGGRTPLAAGLARARQVLAAEAVRDPQRRPLLVVVTDGRANAAGGVGAALAEARALASLGVGAVVVDTEDAAVRLGLAARVAAALGAPCVRLEQLAAQPLAGIVRVLAGGTSGTGEGRRPARSRKVA